MTGVSRLIPPESFHRCVDRSVFLSGWQSVPRRSFLSHNSLSYWLPVQATKGKSPKLFSCHAARSPVSQSWQLASLCHISYIHSNTSTLIHLKVIRGRKGSEMVWGAEYTLDGSLVCHTASLGSPVSSGWLCKHTQEEAQTQCVWWEDCITYFTYCTHVLLLQSELLEGGGGLLGR